ncbi:hypothetical protein YSY43_20320 [Paenibacillus sp. YSY-4.3]
MDWIWLVLMCPLMMVIMMFGMRGGHGQGRGSHGKGIAEDTERMQREINELKAQNEQLRRDIQSVTC